MFIFGFAPEVAMDPGHRIRLWQDSVFYFGPRSGVKNIRKSRPSVKRNFWPLRNFWPVVCQFCQQKVDEWMRYKKLSSNYSKTTYMLLNRNLSQSCNFNVKINDNKMKHNLHQVSWGVYRPTSFLDRPHTW